MEHEENVVFGTNFKCALRRDFPKRNLFFWVRVTSLTLKVPRTHFKPLFKQFQYGLLDIQILSLYISPLPTAGLAARQWRCLVYCDIT